MITRGRNLLVIALGMGVIVGCTTILPAAVLQPSPPGWAPQWLRYWAADVRLGVAPIAKKVFSFGRINLPDLRVYSDTAGQVLRLTRRDVTLVGTLTRPTTTGPHPALLVLHGSTPEGRGMGLYRVLARDLSRRGYVVLNLDQRGFGDSDDPPNLHSNDAFDFVGDARHAVDHLARLPGVDSTQVAVLGHSLGGSIGLAAALDHDRVWKIVAIGPTRRFTERIQTELEYRRRRAMRIMRLADMIPPDVYLNYRNATNMELLGSHLGRPGHKPLMLIDGGQESRADRRFMEAIVRDSIAEPRTHLRLSTGDHFANVVNVGHVVIYDREVLRQLVDGIDQWLRSD